MNSSTGNSRVLSHATEPPCPKSILSETKDSFRLPRIKEPTPTRARRFEQFLWQELYEEYLRTCKDSLKPAEDDKLSTEYFEAYCKHIPQEDLIAKEELIALYPVYCTNAITIYNHAGAKNFKKRYAITRPVGEQTSQWG